MELYPYSSAPHAVMALIEKILLFLLHIAQNTHYSLGILVPKYKLQTQHIRLYEYTAGYGGACSLSAFSVPAMSLFGLLAILFSQYWLAYSILRFTVLLDSKNAQ